MKLQIFQSDKGDCILLEGADGGRILCDGGMRSSMKSFVREELGTLRRDSKKLDAIYISHVDQDHISGVVQLLEDELEWRAYEFHKDNASPIRKPPFARPPEIGGIWHNAFRDQVDKNAGDIEKLLAAAVPSLLTSSNPALIEIGREMRDIAASIPEALKVSRYASPEILKIPVNTIPGEKAKKLLMIRDRQNSFKIGSLEFTIIGPSKDELEQLRKGWNNFLSSEEGEKALDKLREEIRRRIEGLTSSALELRDWYGVPDFKNVTTPNIASLIFHVRDGNRQLLLTGDSQQDIIVAGLEKTGFLKNGSLHVDILKVQHHGSEHNIDADFCRKISADHYVFCGDGFSGNPELSVLQMIFDSRLGGTGKRALAPDAADRDFTFWFSTTSERQTINSKERLAYEAVERLVGELVDKAKGRMKAKFNTGVSIELEV